MSASLPIPVQRLIRWRHTLNRTPTMAPHGFGIGHLVGIATATKIKGIAGDVRRGQFATPLQVAGHRKQCRGIQPAADLKGHREITARLPTHDIGNQFQVVLAVVILQLRVMQYLLEIGLPVALQAAAHPAPLQAYAPAAGAGNPARTCPRYLPSTAPGTG